MLSLAERWEPLLDEGDSISIERMEPHMSNPGFLIFLWIVLAPTVAFIVLSARK